uniref:Uncharacterized protein n=1 Tax=Acrobeloides nanus TaxID=290746 RepID=A0A914CUD0_9BILA
MIDNNNHQEFGKNCETFGGNMSDNKNPNIFDRVTQSVGQAVAETVENSVDVVGIACETAGQVFEKNRCNQL